MKRQALAFFLCGSVFLLSPQAHCDTAFPDGPGYECPGAPGGSGGSCSPDEAGGGCSSCAGGFTAPAAGGGGKGGNRGPNGVASYAAGSHSTPILPPMANGHVGTAGYDVSAPIDLQVC